MPQGSLMNEIKRDLIGGENALLFLQSTVLNPYAQKTF